MAAPLASVHQERARRLSDPALYASVRNFVRGRVPAGDVDDVVQTTLTDALSASDAPSCPEEFRRWVFGIAHNKVVDLFRRRKRSPEPSDGTELPAAEGHSPVEARELLAWVDREISSNEAARSTLEWMLREGDGDSLEDIAKEQHVPAPRVRQRVSRLRRHLRSRWAILSAGLGFALLAGLAAILLHRPPAKTNPPNLIVKEDQPQPTPREKARSIRELAFERCARGKYEECLAELDRAKALDAPGDLELRVQEARSEAARAIAPTPKLPPAPSTTPSGHYAPKPAPTQTIPTPNNKQTSDSSAKPRKERTPSNVSETAPRTKAQPATKSKSIEWDSEPFQKK